MAHAWPNMEVVELKAFMEMSITINTALALVPLCLFIYRFFVKIDHKIADGITKVFAECI